MYYLLFWLVAVLITDVTCSFAFIYRPQSDALINLVNACICLAMCLTEFSFFLDNWLHHCSFTRCLFFLCFFLANARCECNVGWRRLQAAAVHWHFYCCGNRPRSHYTNHKRCSCQRNTGNCCLCKGRTWAYSKLRKYNSCVVSCSGKWNMTQIHINFKRNSFEMDLMLFLGFNYH